jgi:DNA-binding transcriptional ArsR family regulator
VSKGSKYEIGITFDCDENHNSAAPTRSCTGGLQVVSNIAILLNMKSVGNAFRALADPTRRQILQELKNGELSAGDIVARFSISGPSISRHLSILKNAELVSERREANKIFYQLEKENLTLAIGDFLSSVCPTQILARHQRKQ